MHAIVTGGDCRTGTANDQHTVRAGLCRRQGCLQRGGIAGLRASLPIHRGGGSPFRLARSGERQRVVLSVERRKGCIQRGIHLAADGGKTVAVNDFAILGDRQVILGHAVLVRPQLGAGVLALGKAVDRSVGDGQIVGRIVIVADLNGRLAGSAVFAVVELGVAHRQVRRILRSRLTVEQDGLAVGVEGAVLDLHIRAAPRPDGVLVIHGVFKGAAGEGRLAVERELALDGAAIERQLIADDAVEVAFARLNGHIVKGEVRAALIVQHAALGADRIGDHIHRLRAVALNGDGARISALVGNAVIQRHGHAGISTMVSPFDAA